MNLVSLRFQMAGFFFFPPIQSETHTMVQTAEVGQCCQGRRGEYGRRSKDKGLVWFSLGQQAQGHSSRLKKS